MTGELLDLSLGLSPNTILVLGIIIGVITLIYFVWLIINKNSSESGFEGDL